MSSEGDTNFWYWLGWWKWRIWNKKKYQEVVLLYLMWMRNWCLNVTDLIVIVVISMHVHSHPHPHNIFREMRERTRITFKYFIIIIIIIVVWATCWWWGWWGWWGWCMLGMDVLTYNVCIVPDINACSNFQIKNYVNFYLLQAHIHENLPSSLHVILLTCSALTSLYLFEVNVQLLSIIIHISRHTFLGWILSRKKVWLVDFCKKKKMFN